MELSEDSLKDIRLCTREINCYKWVPLKDYYEFAQKHSTTTQIIIAEYITRLWKEGFDFEKMVPNVTKNEIKHNQ